METNANRACCVGHVLTICGRQVVLPSWAHENPTDIVDDDAVGGARWGGVVCGGAAAAAEGCARFQRHFNRSIATDC